MRTTHQTPKERRLPIIRTVCCMLLALICLLGASALADAPSSLRECTTEDEALAFLLLPDETADGAAPVSARSGFIRYFAQNALKDPLFCSAYWCSTEAGDNLDLNATVSRRGNTFTDHAGTMCTRAVYAMALSYLGIDVTPGNMSVMLGVRNIDEPYDDVTELLPGVERVRHKSNVFKKMIASYLSDSSYSPVYMYLRKPNGAYHAILIVGKAEDNFYLAVDPATHFDEEGGVVRVYRVRFDGSFRKIISSSFRSEQRGSELIAICQWRRTDGE